jgi:hypothetical protein
VLLPRPLQHAATSLEERRPIGKNHCLHFRLSGGYSCGREERNLRPRDKRRWRDVNRQFFQCYLTIGSKFLVAHRPIQLHLTALDAEELVGISGT